MRLKRSMRPKNMSDNPADDATITVRSKLVFGMRTPGSKRMTKQKPKSHPLQAALFSSGLKRAKRFAPVLPTEDNTPEGLRALLAANAHYREAPWPKPYDRYTHRL